MTRFVLFVLFVLFLSFGTPFENPADFNRDKIVNTADLNIFLPIYVSNYGLIRENILPDLDSNGIVELSDFTSFLGYWVYYFRRNIAQGFLFCDDFSGFRQDYWLPQTSYELLNATGNPFLLVSSEEGKPFTLINAHNQWEGSYPSKGIRRITISVRNLSEKQVFLSIVLSDVFWPCLSKFCEDQEWYVTPFEKSIRLEPLSEFSSLEFKISDCVLFRGKTTNIFEILSKIGSIRILVFDENPEEEIEGNAQNSEILLDNICARS